ncbi:MAG: PilZ domain-containing protein [Candidatus Omnitrophica bacterium]|jgi:c-di-GMP-binding flagellar brake protein YcgR|nr:PilZ domain-containing protein [Candidatus Omnitrophota bacterium]
MYNGVERRRYPRANAGFLVSYKDMYSDSNFNISQTVNVSQGGMLITTSEVFPIGATLKMLTFLPFFSERVNLSGKVVRQKEVAKGFIYETGVEFTNLEQIIFEKLGEFIQRKPR